MTVCTARSYIVTFKCLLGTAPGYLVDLLQKRHNKGTRDDDRNFLVIPKVKRSAFAGRSFSFASLTLWNRLPDDLRLTYMDLSLCGENSAILPQTFCTCVMSIVDHCRSSLLSESQVLQKWISCNVSLCCSLCLVAWLFQNIWRNSPQLTGSWNCSKETNRWQQSLREL